MPDLDEDYNSEETDESIAISHEKIKKNILAAPSKSVIDPMPFYCSSSFIPVHCYPIPITILDAELGFDSAKGERIIVPTHQS